MNFLLRLLPRLWQATRQGWNAFRAARAARGAATVANAASGAGAAAANAANQMPSWARNMMPPPPATPPAATAWWTALANRLLGRRGVTSGLKSLGFGAVVTGAAYVIEGLPDFWVKARTMSANIDKANAEGAAASKPIPAWSGDLSKPENLARFRASLKADEEFLARVDAREAAREAAAQSRRRTPSHGPRPSL